MLNEEIIPTILKTNFWEKYEDFGPIEAYECMEDEVQRVSKCIELHDCLVTTPEKALDKYDLQRILKRFSDYCKELSDGNYADDDTVDKLIDDYIDKVME